MGDSEERIEECEPSPQCIDEVGTCPKGLTEESRRFIKDAKLRMEASEWGLGEAQRRLGESQRCNDEAQRRLGESQRTVKEQQRLLVGAQSDFSKAAWLLKADLEAAQTGTEEEQMRRQSVHDHILLGQGKLGKLNLALEEVQESERRAGGMVERRLEALQKAAKREELRVTTTFKEIMDETFRLDSVAASRNPDPSSKTTLRTPCRQQEGPLVSDSLTENIISRPFCTQKCLLGLVRGELLDKQCPNVSLHCGKRTACDHLHKHRLNLQDWLDILHKQLTVSLDAICEGLGREGDTGFLLYIAPNLHGYTLVAKGTTRDKVPYLRHEATVYQHIRALQGICLPVYLGSLDLIHAHECDHMYGPQELVHLMFLSSAGEDLDTDNASKDDIATWTRELRRTVEAVNKAGVIHNSLKPSNMLWNKEVGRLMLVDFERAEILTSSKRTCTEDDTDCGPEWKKRKGSPYKSGRTSEKGRLKGVFG
ncbi:hypothetical protein W97_03355 [Coniosporium apollinis CBS 100218]|uniref:Protein kinase domain-containing protein n=1 Tax=Coniosporium apollinis (strain CBS 100218) TaxID=1168221 RepID=R7YQE3_CONA1|nr:uncharacterized protein W97_03355 [Coniosporium apollinis CBS 100218]EON64125.1 hypothetical protein W97_03355 [Coniosporium apollinis CBS 100218]